MTIQSKFKNYDVTLETALPIAAELSEPEKSFYAIDKNVYRLYPQLFEGISEDRLYIIDAVESNKTIDTALDICEKITAMSAKRNAVLVSYGGGIVQDITGFAANIMYRGIRWILVPTTLLSACDSCIGSKTSLNYKHFKNLLGTFYPPDRILICPLFFDTLTKADFDSGLGEVVKFNCMRGNEGLDDLEKNLSLLQSHEPTTVNRFVESSLGFKKPFVENDEFDRNERILLNFAHTFGHAIEVTSEYHIPHGSAVAMGMLAADYISNRRGILSTETMARIEALGKQILSLEVRAEWLDPMLAEKAIRKDKKQVDSHITAILPDSDYSLLIVHDLTSEEIAASFDYLKNLFCK